MRKPAPVDHPVHELVAERWSPRAFGEAEVGDGELVAHQMAGFDAERATEVMGLGEGEQPMVALAMGWPTDDLSKLGEPLADREAGPRVRQPQDDFVSHGKVR